VAAPTSFRPATSPSASRPVRASATRGRLDQQRYRYALWTPSPLAGFELGEDEAFVALARRYFSWIGPAKAAHFQWFSGLGVKASKTALDRLGVQEMDDGWLLLPDDRDAFAAFEPPSEPQVSLVSGLDGLILHRRDLASLVDESAASSHVAQRAAGAALGSPDLEYQAIIDRGRLAGLWEFDPVNAAIAWVSFEPPTEAMKQAVRETEAFIRDQLGDARSFSLDSPTARAPRIKAMRSAA
jgi:hypothetical protein